VIDALSAVTGGQSPTAAKDQAIGKQDFLKLLVTQLEQQDPMNPQDGTEFVAQLATFTSLEQLINIEEGLNNVAMTSLATNNTLASNLIGKQVQVRGAGKIAHESGDHTLNFELQGDAEQVTIEIMDEDGQVIRTINGGTAKKGENDMVWDGRDDNGNKVAAGSYEFRIEAEGEEGEPVGARTTSMHLVESVSFQGGVPTLVLSNGDRVEMGDVMEVFDTNAPSSSDSSSGGADSDTDNTVSNSDADAADDQQ
jgi:flagellar basal-body rod modification protein FlgD